MMIMRRTATVVSTISMALALAGCSNDMKKTFGLEANPPNAYEVGTLPPLSLPPELGRLPQPNPGQAPTQEVSGAQQGANIVAPGNALVSNNQALSPAGQALLAQAGPAPAANIRAQVNQNAAVTSRSGGFLDRLVNGTTNTPTVLNANAEQSRLQENAALGQPVTSGNTPTNHSGGFFDRLFNGPTNSSMVENPSAEQSHLPENAVPGQSVASGSHSPGFLDKLINGITDDNTPMVTNPSAEQAHSPENAVPGQSVTSGSHSPGFLDKLINGEMNSTAAASSNPEKSVLPENAAPGQTATSANTPDSQTQSNGLFHKLKHLFLTTP